VPVLDVVTRQEIRGADAGPGLTAVWLVACRRAWKIEYRVSDDPDHVIHLSNGRLDPLPHLWLHRQPDGAIQR
jgi:hypothetical protein